MLFYKNIWIATWARFDKGPGYNPNNKVPARQTHSAAPTALPGFIALTSSLGMDQTAKDCITEACFEKESYLEIAKGRRTSFDFYMQIKPNTKIFFEIKYSENGFGKAAKDDEHLSHYYKVYEPLLNNNPAIKDSCKNEEYFLNHYQIMRNLLHIDANSTVVFIYPQDNMKINEEALRARAEVMTPGWESKFILYPWEGLLRELFKHLNDKHLIDYYDAFADKYLKY